MELSVSISWTFRVLFTFTSVSHAFKDSFSLNRYVSISCISHWIAMSVCRALLRFSFIGLLSQDLAQFSILFQWIITIVSCVILVFSFDCLLHQFLMHFWDSLWSDCYLSISHAFRFSFIELLRWFFVYFKNSLWLDCYIGISRTFSILLHWIVTYVCRAL